MVENGGWPMMLAKAYVLRRTGSGETEESYLRDKEHDLYEGRWQEITGIYKQAPTEVQRGLLGMEMQFDQFRCFLARGRPSPLLDCVGSGFRQQGMAAHELGRSRTSIDANRDQYLNNRADSSPLWRFGTVAELKSLENARRTCHELL
jgi:hypothetical protein